MSDFMKLTNLKMTFISIAMLLSIFLSACGGTKPNEPKDGAEEENTGLAIGQGQVQVFYLHATNRCPSCNAIEAGTRKTIDAYFKSQLENKEIQLSVLNIEEPANKEITEKYQAIGPTLLVIYLDKDKKEVVNDLTGDGFRYALNDEAQFISVLKAAIEEALNK